MTPVGAPVSEEELHAYLDGELSDGRRAAVATYLREHPEELRRLQAYRVDGEAVRRLFSDPPDAGPAPRERKSRPPS
jgi:anti-sigma factor RsiW